MATPRSQLIDPDHPLHYHLVSRCVRKSWLCGFDRQTNKDYEHRKVWLRNRLMHLARYFAVAVDAYAIMSNHFHVVIYYDPRESQRWSDEEVAARWVAAFPPRIGDHRAANKQAVIELHQRILIEDSQRLRHARETLGSLSMFMKYLKQPIAYRANIEDECSGHFFEGRFYSGALLDEDAVIAAMAYVDLNPVTAKIVSDIKEYRAASGYQRASVARNSAERLHEAIEPLVSGLTTPRPALESTLGAYLGIVESCQIDYEAHDRNDRTCRWFNRITSLQKRQRAFGSIKKLSEWKVQRGWRLCDTPLPIS